MYSGWLISNNSIQQIKNLFEQTHPDFIGHHVTYMFGDDSELSPEATLKIIGQCTTNKIQCFVITVNDEIIRPDGNLYHLTWSIDKSKGAKPVDSNKAIIEYGFVHLDKPIEIFGTPKIFKF
jgi:hypothetical protein